MMYITFLIGNGFDLGLGLATRYTDFYRHFLNNAKKDNIIREWMESDGVFHVEGETDEDDEARKRRREWSNLEKNLGNKLAVLTKDEIRKFNLDKGELIRLLQEYLLSEQDKFQIEGKETKAAQKLKASLLNFHTNTADFAENDIASLKGTFDKYKKEEYRFRFVSFNYTNTLDTIVDLSRAGNSILSVRSVGGGKRNNILDPVFHVHGKLGQNMIIGVNDASQINNPELNGDEDLLDVMIKERMNSILGNNNTRQVMDAIDKSHIICIFGMSLGDTDKNWWKRILEWLKKPAALNKLIIYCFGYKNETVDNIPELTIPLVKDLKNKFLEQAEADMEDDWEEIKSRIFIVFNSKIFNFTDILNEEITETI